MREDLNVIIHFFQRLGEFPAVKIAVGIFVWLVHLMFGTAFRPAYGVVGLLWLVDTLTGYYHSWANPAIIPESRRMYHGLVKLTVYYFLMFLGYQVARMGLEIVMVMQTTIEVAIVFTEFKSVIENVKKIGTLKKWSPSIMALINQIAKLLEGKCQEAMEGGGKRYDQKRVRNQDNDCRPAGTESRSTD
jgi:disulfide bond formation protein DsbB